MNAAAKVMLLFGMTKFFFCFFLPFSFFAVIRAAVVSVFSAVSGAAAAATASAGVSLVGEIAEGAPDGVGHGGSYGYDNDGELCVRMHR